MKVAKATQKPGQSKEQTKLIALGIEKGIAEYKKQQKSKAREKDKARKQELKAKARTNDEVNNEVTDSHPQSARLPWILLLVSWLGFAAFTLLI